MSLRYEQYRSLYITREFLVELLTGPRLPTRVLREKAKGCLRHYPVLLENGEPMFSRDEFKCPNIEEAVHGDM